ncbi:MAG TPA: RNA polymerase sigma factor [Gammaproteobacteria bacterium]|nr:RNA polymerase sigma factor [Gammaproteobacteria bacterium]
MQAIDNDEADLVEQAGAGDVAAFEQLYRMHSGRVYGLCVRLAANRAEAEDCTQDTFVTAWQRLADFRGDSRLSTWLHTIAYHEVIGRRRRETRNARHLSAAGAGEAERVDYADSAELEDLERAILRLPDRAREAFVLQKIYGYTHDEAAGIMGITAGACKSQVHRAVQLLAGALPRENGDDDGTGMSAGGGAR